MADKKLSALSPLTTADAADIIHVVDVSNTTNNAGGENMKITKEAFLGTTAEDKGGTGETTYSQGQLLIGNAAGGLTKSTLTAGSNVTITEGDGSISIASSGGGGGGSDITITDESSSLTTAVESIDFTGAGVTATASGNDVTVSISGGGGGGGAPTGAAYVTLSTDNDLSAERVLTAGEGIAITDGGAGGNITIDGEDATETNKGIAKYNSANFLVTSGDVTIKDGGVALAEMANLTDGTLIGNQSGTAAAPSAQTIGIADTNIVRIDGDDADKLPTSGEFPRFTSTGLEGRTGPEVLGDIQAAAASHNHNASALNAGTVAHERGGLEADVNAYDGYIRISGGVTSEVKCKFNGTTAPTTTDDTNSGWDAGSRWVDTTNEKEYVCLDNTASNAAWTETTSVVPANNAVLDATQQWTKAQIPKTYSDTFANLATTGTLDFDTYQNFVVTLTTGTNAFQNPTTDTGNVGQTGVIVFVQTSAATATFTGNYKTIGGSGITLSTWTTGTVIDVVPYIIKAEDEILLGAPQLNFS